MRFIIPVALIISVISVFMLLLGILHEYKENSVFRDDIQEQNLQGLFDFYVDNLPAIDGRPFIGDDKPGMTFVVVVDFLSPESEEFYREVVPFLIENYVEQGNAKVIHKYYLTEEDFESRTGRFKYSAAAVCYYRLGGEDVQAFHEALFGRDLDGIKEIFGLGQDFDECTQSKLRVIEEDFEESRKLIIVSPSIHIGIEGRDNAVLYGIPSEARINRITRFQQIKLGI